MGITAENVAKRFGISRERAGRVRRALARRRAGRASRAGSFNDEIVPRARRASSKAAREHSATSRVDECPRPDTTLEGLAKLQARVHARAAP